MAKKRIFTEEQKEKRKEYFKKWYQKNKIKFNKGRKEYQNKYREENKDKISEYNKQYYQDNKEDIAEYYQDNKEVILKRQKQYHQTPNGRAINLVNAYRQKDKEANRGECTLTPEWMVDNIFSGQKCIYCGESDWHKLGCDRIYNDKPHTPDNVNPCCEECNKKRGKKDFEEYLLEVDISH